MRTIKMHKQQLFSLFRDKGAEERATGYFSIRKFLPGGGPSRAWPSGAGDLFRSEAPFLKDPHKRTQ